MTVQKARLFEVSLVSTPAYAAATVTGVRSMATPAVLELARQLDAPLMAHAITGSPATVLAAVETVRGCVREFGMLAPYRLSDMATETQDGEMAVNLARSAGALEGLTGPARFHRAYGTQTVVQRRRRRR